MSKSSNSGSSQGRRSSGRRRKSNKKTVNPDDFWGKAEDLPRADVKARITSDPSAVVRSLGRAPLSGHHNAADHYFAAVYERSVSLASALAAAGDMVETDELVADRS
ncbi:MAG: hypothetical protein OEV40_14985 [Acidimicrobiia bacterium]|nr:hypothetical protein [Acidimicrobiia bacterium]